MKIYRIPVGELLANCYIIETENKNAVAIDPGSDFQRIKNLLDEHELTLKKILLTHGHYDHIGAAGEAADVYGAQVYIHEEDAPMLASGTKSLADAIGAGQFNEITKFTTVTNGDVIILDELSFEVIHTPGHTRGGVCYKCGNALFTGIPCSAVLWEERIFRAEIWEKCLSHFRKLQNWKEIMIFIPGIMKPVLLHMREKIIHI